MKAWGWEMSWTCGIEALATAFSLWHPVSTSTPCCFDRAVRCSESARGTSTGRWVILPGSWGLPWQPSPGRLGLCPHQDPWCVLGVVGGGTKHLSTCWAQSQGLAPLPLHTIYNYERVIRPHPPLPLSYKEQDRVVAGVSHFSGGPSGL